MPDDGTVVETFQAPVARRALDLVQDVEVLWARDGSVEPAARQEAGDGGRRVIGNIIEHAFAADSAATGRVLQVVLTLGRSPSRRCCPTTGCRPSRPRLRDDARRGRRLRPWPGTAVAAVDEMATSGSARRPLDAPVPARPGVRRTAAGLVAAVLGVGVVGPVVAAGGATPRARRSCSAPDDRLPTPDPGGPGSPRA